MGGAVGALHEHLPVSALLVIVFLEFVCPLLFRCVLARNLRYCKLICSLACFGKELLKVLVS